MKAVIKNPHVLKLAAFSSGSLLVDVTWFHMCSIYDKIFQVSPYSAYPVPIVVRGIIKDQICNKNP